MMPPNLDATAAAEHFFAGAVAAGMTHAIVSPGSRSTPLALAADRTPGLDIFVHLDERCAAFAALGQAKLSGSPVALICTSGTAAANYLPAVAESALSNVPLVVITADRPPEHQHIGVGQSFDQRGLYRAHVRDEVTMPVGGDGGADFTVRAGWRSATTAVEKHGPVHVNWAFRLPLEPTGGPIRSPAVPTRAVSSAEPIPNDEEVTAFIDTLRGAERPVIIAGPDAATTTNADAISNAAAALGVPVLADTLSGLRGPSRSAVLDASSLVVEGELPAVDLVVRIGNTPTSKSTRLWWESTGATHLLIDPLDDWHDPSNLVTQRLRCAPTPLFTAAQREVPAFDAAWHATWTEHAGRAARVRSEVLDEWPSVTEAHVAAQLELALAAEDVLVASSSMPIRDIDTFTSASFGARVVANRGINGIDGVVSTAIGASRSSPGAHTTVLIGDVAALHDIGGILDAARQGIDLTVLIPNNDGGGIFSFLPAKQAIEASQFERLFHTPHGSSFEFLDGHDGITYQRVAVGNDHAALAEVLRGTRSTPGVHVIEVPVSTPDRLAVHAALLDRIRS